MFEFVRSVVRATGESASTIRSRGFQMIPLRETDCWPDWCPAHEDPDPQTLDWDDVHCDA